MDSDARMVYHEIREREMSRTRPSSASPVRQRTQIFRARPSYASPVRQRTNMNRARPSSASPVRQKANMSRARPSSASAVRERPNDGMRSFDGLLSISEPNLEEQITKMQSDIDPYDRDLEISTLLANLSRVRPSSAPAVRQRANLEERITKMQSDFGPYDRDLDEISTLLGTLEKKLSRIALDRKSPRKLKKKKKKKKKRFTDKKKLQAHKMRQLSNPLWGAINNGYIMHAADMTAVEKMLTPQKPRPKVSLADQLNSVEKLSRPLPRSPPAKEVEPRHHSSKAEHDRQQQSIARLTAAANKSKSTYKRTLTDTEKAELRKERQAQRAKVKETVKRLYKVPHRAKKKVFEVAKPTRRVRRPRPTKPVEVRACWLAEPPALAPLTTLGTSYSQFQRVIVHIMEDYIQTVKSMPLSHTEPEPNPPEYLVEWDLEQDDFVVIMKTAKLFERGDSPIMALELVSAHGKKLNVMSRCAQQRKNRGWFKWDEHREAKKDHALVLNIEHSKQKTEEQMAPGLFHGAGWLTQTRGLGHHNAWVAALNDKTLSNLLETIAPVAMKVAHCMVYYQERRFQFLWTNCRVKIGVAKYKLKAGTTFAIFRGYCKDLRYLNQPPYPLPCITPPNLLAYEAKNTELKILVKAYLCATSLAFSDGVAMQSVAFGAEGEQQQLKGDGKSVGKEQKEQDSDSEDDSALGAVPKGYRALLKGAFWQKVDAKNAYQEGRFLYQDSPIYARVEEHVLMERAQQATDFDAQRGKAAGSREREQRTKFLATTAVLVDAGSGVRALQGKKKKNTKGNEKKDEKKSEKKDQKKGPKVNGRIRPGCFLWRTNDGRWIVSGRKGGNDRKTNGFWMVSIDRKAALPISVRRWQFVMVHTGPKWRVKQQAQKQSFGPAHPSFCCFRSAHTRHSMRLCGNTTADALASLSVRFVTSAFPLRKSTFGQVDKSSSLKIFNDHIHKLLCDCVWSPIADGAYYQDAVIYRRAMVRQDVDMFGEWYLWRSDNGNWAITDCKGGGCSTSNDLWWRLGSVLTSMPSMTEVPGGYVYPTQVPPGRWKFQFYEKYSPEIFRPAYTVKPQFSATALPKLYRGTPGVTHEDMGHRIVCGRTDVTFRAEFVGIDGAGVKHLYMFDPPQRQTIVPTSEESGPPVHTWWHNELRTRCRIDQLIFDFATTDPPRHRWPENTKLLSGVVVVLDCVDITPGLVERIENTKEEHHLKEVCSDIGTKVVTHVRAFKLSMSKGFPTSFSIAMPRHCTGRFLVMRVTEYKAGYHLEDCDDFYAIAMDSGA